MVSDPRTNEQESDVRRQRPSRRTRPNLLPRPPLGLISEERGWAGLFVDPVDQLNRLAELREQGLLSSEEFAQQARKVADR